MRSARMGLRIAVEICVRLWEMVCTSKSREAVAPTALPWVGRVRLASGWTRRCSELSPSPGLRAGKHIKGELSMEKGVRDQDPARTSKASPETAAGGMLQGKVTPPLCPATPPPSTP